MQLPINLIKYYNLFSVESAICSQKVCFCFHSFNISSTKHAGVQIASVVPEVINGAPLIENAQDQTTWINIGLNPSANSASIIGDNLWTATCYANDRHDGSGIRYSVQNAILQQSELDKDLIYSKWGC